MAAFDRRWTAGLVLLGLVSRLPFLTKILYHWDAVNFTLALKEYNIAIHQPQPPGYLLYVLLGRVFSALIPDPNLALSAISILSSIVAAVALYFLGARMFDRRSGAAASLLLLLSPLIWFYSDIAKPNIIDAPMVTLVALCLWRFMRGERRFLWISAVLLGLAGGFRQQTLIFLAPLAVFAFRKARFGQMLLGAAVAGAVFLASFIPMVMLAGGLAQYQAAVSALSNSFFTHTSILMGAGLRGLGSNVVKWVSFTLFSLLLALIPLALWPLARPRMLRAAWRDERAWFLLCWVLPSLLFYTLIHMGSHGLIFTYLPALFLLAGKALVDVAGRLRRRAFQAGLLAILAVNVFVFVIPPDSLFGGRVHIVNRFTLAENDRLYLARFDMLRGLPAAETLIITQEWRHLQYYLPEYSVLSAPCQAASEDSGGLDALYVVHGGRYREATPATLPDLLPAGIRSVVLLDGPQGCFFPSGWAGRLQKVSENGVDLYVMRLAAGEDIRYTNSMPAQQP